MKGLTPRGRTLVTVGAVLVLLFALSGSLMISKTPRIPKP